MSEIVEPRGGIDWERRAVLLAGATVAWNVVEGLFAVGFGIGEESLALLGFGLDSWVEVGSAGVVLWKLSGGDPSLERERRATTVIGALLALLGVSIGIGALLQLATAGHPQTTVPGLVVSILSLGFMAWLWRAKVRAAEALDSRTLQADAACSRSCIQLSVVLLAGSLLYVVAPALWWADGLAALVLGGLVAREGVGTWRAARHEGFDGGCCGCGD